MRSLETPNQKQARWDAESQQAWESAGILAKLFLICGGTLHAGEERLNPLDSNNTSTPLFFFYCARQDHGLQKDYRHGYSGELRCSICEKSFLTYHPLTT